MSVGRRILAVPIRCANRQCNLNTIQRKVAKESKERKETQIICSSFAAFAVFASKGTR
jgi:hypothetical protein